MCIQSVAQNLPYQEPDLHWDTGIQGGEGLAIGAERGASAHVTNETPAPEMIDVQGLLVCVAANYDNFIPTPIHECSVPYPRRCFEFRAGPNGLGIPLASPETVSLMCV
jgi:hypothetical protein